MKNKGRRIKKGFRRATAILLALIVVVLISSCSSDIPQLCNVSVQLEGSGSRELSAVIDPLSGYTIYYKSIYRGSGASYGNMAESPYKKLDENGILVSQGLWEIKVILSTNPQWDGKGTGSTSDLVASSGDVFINLNTTSITVQLQNNIGKGYIYISSYELVEPPKNVSITVTYYKYDETKSSFSSTGTLSVQKSETGNVFSSNKKEIAWSGTYYAVVEVKGSVSGTQKTLFTDCIGFVVRGGLTTNISGSCSTYNYSSSSNGNFIVTEKDQSDKAEIKNFIGSEFNNNGTYTITGGTYELIPDNKSDPTRTNKVLGNNQDIKINMNGYAIVNSNETLKTSFTIGSGAKLTIFNDNKDNSKKAKTIGYEGNNPNSNDTNPNFIVNGGTLTIGSTSPTVEGSIDLKGGPASLSSSETKHAAIVLSKNGGTVNLYSPGNGSYVKVEETTIGIATAFDDTYEKKGTAMDIFINMVNSSIYAQGDMNDYATGIRLDGTKSTSENYSGTINIDIKGKGIDDHSIQTSYDDTGIATTDIENSCIYIRNYAGTINLSFDENASLYSKNGYAIALENCTGQIIINNKGNLLGSIKKDGITRSTGTGTAIYLKNCSNSVTIINSGTLSKDDSNYQVYSANSKVTVRTTDESGNVIGTDVEIYQPPAISN